MTCRQIIESSRTETAESSTSLSRPCGREVRQWRECGNGKVDDCKEKIAYCEAHGGLDRATEEMAQHMDVHRVLETGEIVELESIDS